MSTVVCIDALKDFIPEGISYICKRCIRHCDASGECVNLCWWRLPSSNSHDSWNSWAELESMKWELEKLCTGHRTHDGFLATQNPSPTAAANIYNCVSSVCCDSNGISSKLISSNRNFQQTNFFQPEFLAKYFLLTRVSSQLISSNRNFQETIFF